MAENKKKKNSSKSKSEKEPEETKPEKPEISMPAVPEPESESKTEQEEPEKKGFSVQVYSVCLFASSVLTALLIFVQGSAMWKVLHEALKGFFGIPVIAIPVGLFLFARQVDEKKQKENLKNQLKWMGISLVFASCFIEIIFGKGRVLNYNFAQCFKMFYEDGIAWRGGGMLSALAYPILYLFGDVGSKILICLLLFVSIMLLSKKSLTELFEIIKNFFQNIFCAIRQDRKDEKFLKQYEQEQLAHELHDEQEALEIAEQGAIKNLSVIQENLFSIDIPIKNEKIQESEEIEPEIIASKKRKAKSRKKIKSNMNHVITSEMILQKIDSHAVTGIQFEEIICKILEFNGYVKIEQTKASGDNGIDVLAEKDNISYAIQCKCYSKPVGNKAVQEAFTGNMFYKKLNAVVMTNNTFTKSAIETAEKTNVLLWDRKNLMQMLNQISYDNLVELADFIGVMPDDSNPLERNYSESTVIAE